jgi:hypothetical protein
MKSILHVLLKFSRILKKREHAGLGSAEYAGKILNDNKGIGISIEK